MLSLVCFSQIFFLGSKLNPRDNNHGLTLTITPSESKTRYSLSFYKYCFWSAPGLAVSRAITSFLIIVLTKDGCKQGTVLFWSYAFLAHSRKASPIIKISASKTVIRRGDVLLDMKILVGPSAPPIIPIAPVPLVATLNL